MDLSILSGYTGYTSMMLAASKASRAAAASKSTEAEVVKVPTPWDTSNAKSESERLRAAMQATKLVNEHDSSFDKDGVPEDHKKLFALYKALSTLQTLADSAAKKETMSGLLPGLDKRFQTGFAEIVKYAGDLSLETLSLAVGPKRQKAETDVSVTRSTAPFRTKMLVQGDPQVPMAALENASPFKISVSRGGTSTPTEVTIDLAGMGTTPRNLGNVVNYINEKLGEAGIQTRLKRVELPSAPVAKGQTEPPKQYAIQVEGNGSEMLSFAATATKPALYLASEGIGTAELRKLDISGADPATVFKAPIDDDGSNLNVKTQTRDAQGNIFVVGTTSANQGTSQINQAASHDVMIRKYDSAGNLLWSKLLGATDKADGLAVATDSKGAVVVAGQITGKLGTAVSAGGLDSYVVKISAAGEEVFARQIGSALDDGATALTVGPDDAIYVGGTVKGRMTGAAASNGGADGYVVKFNATGTRQYTRQFGGAGDEKVSALAITDSGDLVVASNDGGQGTIRKFSSADATSAAIWTQSIGDLAGGGNIAGLAVEGNQIYLAGSTANPGLNGWSGIVTAHSGGGQDGFVARLDDNGASVSTGMVTYLGTGSTDRINGLTVAGGRIYVAGDTKGTLPGGATATRADVFNSFAAELSSTGQLDWARQFGVSTGEGYGRGISVDTQGASVLDALGLPTGKLAPQQARTLTAQTSVRPGDYFEIKIGELAARKITIEAGETMTTLARKVNRVLFLDGKASVVRTSAGERLRIEPNAGEAIELKAGAGNLDALKGLGLSPGRVVKEAVEGEDKKDEDDAIPAFALGLKSSYSLGSTASAAVAKAAIDSAMSEIRSAYREITMDPEVKKLLKEGQQTKGKQGGSVPSYLTSQLANYNAGLSRLQSGSTTSSLF